MYRCAGLEEDAGAIFDSVIVVTDRKMLDKQIKNIIKQLTQVGGSAKAKRAIAIPQRRIPQSAKMHRNEH